MQRSLILRAAAVLAITVLAACDAPATLPDTTPFETGARRGEAPALTVAESGGYPLISWTPPAGAVSYTVVFWKQTTSTVLSTGESTTNETRSVLGATAGSSFLDTSRAYTGDVFCSSSYGSLHFSTPWAPQGLTLLMTSYRYEVTATFTDGSTATSWIGAPVSPC